MYRGMTRWGHMEMTAMHKPRSEDSEENNLPDSLISDLCEIQKMWGNNLMFWKLPSLWHFAMVMLSNEYTTQRTIRRRGSGEQKKPKNFSQRLKVIYSAFRGPAYPAEPLKTDGVESAMGDFSSFLLHSEQYWDSGCPRHGWRKHCQQCSTLQNFGSAT